MIPSAWQALRAWWRRQWPRYAHRRPDGGTHTDGNKYDVVELELRQRAGVLLQAMNPAYGACRRCAFPWWAVDGHTTKIDRQSGCFPLCEKCWRELGVSSYRMPYYRAMWEGWQREGYEKPWSVFEAAVLAENDPVYTAELLKLYDEPA